MVRLLFVACEINNARGVFLHLNWIWPWWFRNDSTIPHFHSHALFSIDALCKYAFFSFSFQITMKGNKLAFFLLLVLAFEILFFTATEANPFWTRRRRRRRRRCSSSRPAGVAWVNGWQQYFNFKCQNSKRQFHNLLVLFLLLISSKQRKEHFNWKKKSPYWIFFCFMHALSLETKLPVLGTRRKMEWGLEGHPNHERHERVSQVQFFFFTKSMLFYSLLFISKYHLFRGIIHFWSIRAVGVKIIIMSLLVIMKNYLQQMNCAQCR